MSGGVRNLRAMFENKDTSTSPPADRGRSPSGSTGVASNGTSPRPLSKVRTSFVTVEKSGQMGLQLRREPSGEPSMSKRRTSFSISEEEHPQETAERKESIASELIARKNSSVIAETIPESAIETPTVEADKRLGAPKDLQKTSKAEGKKPASSTSKAAEVTTNGHANGNSKVSTKSVEKATSSKPTPRPAPISTTKPAVAAKVSPTKSSLPKTPTTPRGRGRPEPAKKEPDKKPEKAPRASMAPSQSSKPTTRPAASGPAPKTRIQASPPQTGFVKPKPRSPTRPVKLPASLTAHTASSGSKTATAPAPTGRQSLSRASGNAQPASALQAQHSSVRSPSRGSTTSLSRQGSTLNKGSSRPSLGPPPAALKKQSSRQSLPQQGAPADEGFLARMMRPTTSSASKTLEKQPDTPPKKTQTVKRPTTNDGPSKPREASKATSSAPKPKAATVAKPAAKEPKPKPVGVKKEAPKEKAKPVVEASTSKVEAPGVAAAAASSGALETHGDEADAVQATSSGALDTAEVEADTAQAPGVASAAASSGALEAPEDDGVAAKDFEEESGKVEETEEGEPATLTVEEEPTVEEETVPEIEEPEAAESEVSPETAKNIPATSVEPPTPVVAQEETSESKLEAEEVIADEVEVKGESEAEAIPDPKEFEIAEAEAELEQVEEAEEEEIAAIKEEKIVEQVVTKPAIIEDPEDVKAREEIAKLNAEVMKAAEAEAERANEID